VCRVPFPSAKDVMELIQLTTMSGFVCRVIVGRKATHRSCDSRWHKD
jgi:hypothetical protein